MIEEKERLLAGEKPRCRVSRDLNFAAVWPAVLDRGQHLSELARVFDHEPCATVIHTVSLGGANWHGNLEVHLAGLRPVAARMSVVEDLVR